MKSYYAARAREYEQIYAKPERQADLRILEQLIPQLLAGRRVLEVACGTGYWTQFLATTATQILATDVNNEVLQVAAQKALPPERVTFRQEDAYAPAEPGSAMQTPVTGGFDAAFAGFWWSHLTHQDQQRFLQALNTRLKPGARVLLLDNRFVPGSSTPIAERDAEGNTYQLRPLADGSVHRVLKNFPQEADLLQATSPFGSPFLYRSLPHYWLFGFVKSESPA